MKSRLYLVCGGLLVAAVAGAVWRWWPWAPPEPVYEGKPVSNWLGRTQVWPPRYLHPHGGSLVVDGREFADPLGCSWARQLAGDSNAVPFLMATVKRDRWPGQTYYRRWLWPKLPSGIKRHLAAPTDNAAERQDAALFLGCMGVAAKQAIPVLIRALRTNESEQVRAQAAWAAAKVGGKDSAVIAALNEALKDRDGRVRGAATISLFEIDSAAAYRAGLKPVDEN